MTLTNDDFGVLNYAYALEQLEAPFYTRVVGSFFSGATSEERSILTDISDHEVAHRDFFKQALGIRPSPTWKPISAPSTSPTATACWGLPRRSRISESRHTMEPERSSPTPSFF